MALQPITVQETQISAIQDDNTPEGVLKAKIMQGDYVKVPASSIEYASTGGGAGVSTLSYQYPQNKDGSSSNIFMTCGAAGIGNIILISTIIYGRVFGLRWLKGLGIKPFSVIIDGIAYDIDTYSIGTYFDNVAATSITDNECDYIIADNLEHKPHTVKIVMQPDPVSVSNLSILGFLLDRYAGYKDFIPPDHLYSKGTLTNSAVNIPMTGSSGVMKSLKKVVYHNIDSTAHVVTIMYAGVVFRVLDIAAGKSVEYEFSNYGITTEGYNSATTGFQHLADVNSMVNFSLIGSKI